jgi:activator of HSP90 ATPase
MKESMELTVQLNASVKEIYNAWLDSEKHSKMTGAVAKCSNELGGKFDIWEGYITGENMDLIENEEILQSWRTTEFDSADEDSVLHLYFTENDKGTLLTLNHSNIPSGQTQYIAGWEENHFVPMREFFNR